MAIEFYILESENPKQALKRLNRSFGDSSYEERSLERAKTHFDVSEEDIEYVLDEGKIAGQVLDENRVFIWQNNTGKYIAKMPCPEKNPKKFSDLADVVSRLVKVRRDTHNNVGAILYSITENSLKKIDEKHTYLYISSKNEENPTSEDNQSPYQGYSYLPAYFYHKHGFKMVDKNPGQEIDYENLYNPEDHPDEEYICSVCKSNEIKQEGWDFTCKNCGYEDSAPLFREHDRIYPREINHISKEESRKLIIELDGENYLWQIEETTLLDALNRCKESYGINDSTVSKIDYINKAQKRPALYKIQGSTIRVNKEEVNPPYDFKLSGSEEIYPKYNISLPSSEDRVLKIKKLALKSIKTLFVILSILIILSHLSRLSQLY